MTIQDKFNNKVQTTKQQVTQMQIEIGDESRPADSPLGRKRIHVHKVLGDGALFPRNMNEQTDTNYLKNKAYENASHLNIRQRITDQHRRHRQGWYRWLYEQIALPTEGMVLDLGSGAGDLWLKNSDHLPSTRHHILTDLSLGMVQDGRQQLVQSSAMKAPFSFGVANATAIPFATQQFEAVLALGLLDHVPSRVHTLTEIKRVLKPNGRSYFSAGGASHLHELDELIAPFLPEAQFGGDPDRFGLQNGETWLTPFFQDISLKCYRNELVFPQASPILAYVLSETAVAEHLSDTDKTALSHTINQKLAQAGEIRLTIEKGVFITTA